MALAPNPTYDPTITCTATLQGPSDTYCSPCNWKTYPGGNDGIPADPTGFVGYIVSTLNTEIKKAVTTYTGDSWIVQPFAAVAFFIWVLLLTVRTAAITVLMKLWPLRSGCDNDTHRNAVTNKEIVGGYLGAMMGVPDSLRSALDRRVAFTCPTEIPGPGEMNAARLRGFLDEDQWKFGQQLNGQCIDWQSRVYLTQQTTLTIPEAVKLWCSDVITAADLPSWFRANGVINQKVVDGYKYLYEVTPGIGDCFYALAHNTEDQKTDDLFGLSSDFDARMTPNIELWLRKTGYSRDMLKFLWKQQRQPVSYRMIGQLYATGQIERGDLDRAFMAMGFTRTVAEWMHAMTIQTTRGRVAALSGKPSLAELERWYITGVIDEPRYRNELLDQEVDAGDVGNFVARADTRRKEAVIKATVRWAKRAFIAGLIDKTQASVNLTNAGMADAFAQTLTDAWAEEIIHGDKSLSLSQLCKMVKDGFLDIETYVDRAKRLGWNAYDATLLAQSCNTDIEADRLRKAEQQQAKALREADKARKAAKAADKALLAKYKDMFPCKPKPKKSCPTGEGYPPIVRELEDRISRE